MTDEQDFSCEMMPGCDLPDFEPIQLPEFKDGDSLERWIDLRESGAVFMETGDPVKVIREALSAKDRIIEELMKQIQR